MAKPITIPNVFQNQVGPIALSQLDADFTIGANAINDLATYNNGVTDTGTVNALVITILAPLAFGYSSFITLDVLVSNTTTSTAPTINVNSLGAKTIVNVDGSALTPGALQSGGIYRLIFDGVNFRTQSQVSAGSFKQLTVGAPLSGSALDVLSVSGGPAITFGGSGAYTSAAINKGELYYDTAAGVLTLAARSSGGSTSINLVNSNAGTDFTRLSINTSGTVTVGPPTSGTALTVSALSGGQAISASGDMSLNQQAVATGANLTLNGGPSGGTIGRIRYTSNSAANNNFAIRDDTSAVDRLTIGNNGNVTIAAPSGGVTLAMTVGPGATAGENMVGQSGGSAATQYGANAGANIGLVGVAGAAGQIITGAAAGDLCLRSNAGSILLGNSTTIFQKISAAGNVTINAPTAGVPLNIPVGTLVYGVGVTATAGNQAAIGIASNGNSVSSTGLSLYQDAASNGHLRMDAGQSLDLQTNSAVRLLVSATGNVTINAPSPSSVALTVTGGAGSYTQNINANTTTSQSFGLEVNAGTNGSDTSFFVQNATGATPYFRVRGDGTNFVGTPGGTPDSGVGVLAVQNGIFANGQAQYRVVAVKSGALSRTNTTTLAADPDLQLTIPVAGTYLIRMFIEFFGATTGTQGFKWNFVGTGVGSANGGYGATGFINGSVFAQTEVSGINTTNTYATISSAVNDWLSLDGVYASFTAGTLIFQWAQNTSSANATTLNNGCYLAIERVS